MKIGKRIILLLADIALVWFSFYFALLIRFEGNIPFKYFQDIQPLYFFSTIYCVGSFYLFGLYRKVWRYASVQELVTIIKAISIAYSPLIIIVFWLKGVIYPRSAIVISFLLALIFIGGIRFILRLVSEKELFSRLQAGKRLLIIGADDAGEMIVREILRNYHLGYCPVGIIDEDKDKLNIKIHGIPVIGNRSDIPKIIKTRSIEEIVITTPKPAIVKEIISSCGEIPVKIKIVPSIGDMIDGNVQIKNMRDVQIEDLLEREPVCFDCSEVSSYIKDKCVLVTGGGGSIGSEVCRQIVNYKPSKIIVLGHGENSVHEITLELTRQKEVEIISFIGDIRDKIRMEFLFSKLKPNVIFHTAAHKHVPLMEQNVYEAVYNNIFGTKLLVELALKNNVERFIFLSTDKAVNPTNIMGITKKVAENIVRLKGSEKSCKFIIVRFGNVLDSAGSVIPTFRRQISMGGPVTVTHQDMTRFFMTIPEAVMLVLQAGGLGEAGDIFILEMGEQINILELARNLIKLSGFEPYQDIPIEITGIRPGEKLHEELLNYGERVSQTSREKILKLITYASENDKFINVLESLENLLDKGDDEKLKNKLFEIEGIVNN